MILSTKNNIFTSEICSKSVLSFSCSISVAVHNASLIINYRNEIDSGQSKQRKKKRIRSTCQSCINTNSYKMYKKNKTHIIKEKNVITKNQLVLPYLL